MAYVHIIDSGELINCRFARVNAPLTKWTPRVQKCELQDSELPNYDSRFIGGDTESDFVVDGC